MEFRDTVVKEIMTPSINLFSLPIDMTSDEMEERILQSGFSRVPIYGETADDIQGVLHIKDLAAAGEGDIDIRSILRTPYYVPEPTIISKSIILTRVSPDEDWSKASEMVRSF